MRRLSLRSLLSGWMLPLLALLVANLVVSVAWTWPRWRSRQAAALDELVAARSRVEPLLQRARSTYGLVAEAEADLEELVQRAAAESSVAELLAVVQETAQQRGLILREARYQTRSIEELDLLQLGMTIPVEGRYANVLAFLGGLTRATEFLLVQGVGVSALAVGNAAVPGGRLRLDLGVSAFLASDDGGEPAPPATSPAGSVSTRGAPLVVADSLADRLERLPPLPVDPEALRVRLDELDTEREPAPSPRRNLFALFEPAPVTPAIQQEQLAEPAASEPEAEPFPLRLLGVAKIEARWHASLTDGLEIWVAAAGTRLPNGFEIVAVGADWVEVSGSDEQPVRLTLEDVAQ